MFSEAIKQAIKRSLNINDDVYNLAAKLPHSYEDVISIYNNCGYNIKRAEKELINMTRGGVRL